MPTVPNVAAVNSASAVFAFHVAFQPPPSWARCCARTASAPAWSAPQAPHPTAGTKQPTVAATVGCFVPAVGWGACGALQAGALAVRAQQRAQEGGGWKATWKANTADALFTAATFGTVGIGARLAKFGRLKFWRQPKVYTKTWNSMRWWHKAI